MEKRKIKRQNIIQLVIMLVIIALISFISGFIHFRFDLTSEKRYTLSPISKQFLKNMDDVIYVKVYLHGDNLPPGFKRLEKATKELLDDFRAYAGENIQYEFIDPSESPDRKTREEIYNQLYGMGLDFKRLTVNEETGSSTLMGVFPGAIISYRSHAQEYSRAVNFLKSTNANLSDVDINASEENLEYELISAMQIITKENVPRVAFVEGHGEWDQYEVASISEELKKYYQVERVKIDGKLDALNGFEVVIIADPKEHFSEKDKFIVDQFIMRGGKTLWFIEALKFEMDSLAHNNAYLGIPNDKWTVADQLFRYGARVNGDIIQDRKCGMIPIDVSGPNERAKFQPFPWPYFPLLTPNQAHPITRNLNLVWSNFASTIDTVNNSPEVRKTPLLVSSKYTRVLRVPARISLDIINEPFEASKYDRPFQTIALLMEGNFDSNYKNRIADTIANAGSIGFIDKSKFTKMIVVGDGEIIKNRVSAEGDKHVYYPVGMDPYSKAILGNRDFLLNAVNYLADDEGLMGIRNREIKLRLLDPAKVENTLALQLINIISPILLVILFGIFYNYFKKRKYTKI